LAFRPTFRDGRQRLNKDVFPSNMCRPADIKDKVRSLLSRRRSVDSDDRANQLIVTDYNENLARLPK